MAPKLKIKAPKAKPKLNKTNIKSPIGSLGDGIGSPAGKKFKSSTLSNQFANQPVLQAPKIDKSPVNTNPIAGVSQTLAETNSILTEIQNQLALDFADRISTEQEEIRKLKAQKNRSRQADAGSDFGSLTALGATLGPKGAAVGAIADVLKAIFGPFLGLFSKIAGFFALVAGGFLMNQGLNWMTNNWETVSGFFDWLGEHGDKILMGLMFGLTGILGFKLFKAIKSFAKFAKGVGKGLITAFKRAKGFITKTLPKMFKGAASAIKGGLSAIKGAGKGIFSGIMNIGGSLVKGAKSVGKVIRTGGKGIIKAAGKSVGKGAGKAVLKKIPVVGLGLGAIFAIDRLRKGDWGGALMELGSGAASMIPGVGTAVSVGLDAALIGKDINDAKNAEGGEVSGGETDDAPAITPTDTASANISSSPKSRDLSPVKRNTGGIVPFPTAEVGGGGDAGMVASAGSGGDSIDSLDPVDNLNDYIGVSLDTFGVVI